jgi:4-hydroxythreonine-4-phosphate dehydrogenase
MPKMVIIADDLTGATDSAAACGEYGMETIVLLGKPDGDDACPETAEALAIDANTRCLAADEAAEVTAKIVRRYGRIGTPTGQALLFKKVDSTLRGNVAAELAAALKARREQAPSGQRVAALLAPAFPAQGRTTVHGRQLLNGRPLEDVNSWQGEHVRPRSNIADVLGDTGLSCALVELATVRSGPHSLEAAITTLASEADVIVCDAATDTDLGAIAISSMALGPGAVFAGSAGLARHIPLATEFGRATGTPGRDREIALVKGPALFVVGSLSDASRKQAQMLAAAPNVETFANPQRTLLKDESNAWREYAELVSKSLERGNDVLLMLNSIEQFTTSEVRLLRTSLVRMLQPLADLVGALVATGGETARTVLQAWGVSQLRLLGEVAPGLPYCVTEQWHRNIPVLTKAGSFGTQDVLLDCRNFIRTIGSKRRRIAEHDTVVENQKS